MGDNKCERSRSRWMNRLVKKGTLNIPLVEITPFVFKERLYRLDNWRGDYAFADGREHCLADAIKSHWLPGGYLV